MKEEMLQEEHRRREETRERPDESLRRILRELIPEGADVEFLDRGSEKLVFIFKNGHQEIVYKIDYRQSVFKDGEARKWDQISRVDMLAETQKLIEERREGRMKLREVFGFHAVPPEKSMVQLLPMSADLYNVIKQHDMEAIDETPKRIPALVTIQKRVELDPENTIDLTASYAETPGKREGDAPEMSEEVYNNAHARLIGGLFNARERIDPKEREKALAECVAMYPDLQQVIDQAEKDPAFQEQLVAAARGLVTYANRPEGTVLDVAGGHNIVIAKKPSTEKEGEHEWQLYLLDALSPDRSVNLSHLPEIAERVQYGRGTDVDRIEALNALHMVRMANALAIIAGISERARLPEAVRRIPGNMWRGFLNDVWSQQERAEASEPDHEAPASSGATRVAVA